MLAAFLIVGVVTFLALRFVAAAAGVRGLPAANLGFVVALLAAFVLAQRAFVASADVCRGLASIRGLDAARTPVPGSSVVPLAAVCSLPLCSPIACWRCWDKTRICRVPAVLCLHGTPLGDRAGVPLSRLVADRTDPALRGHGRPARGINLAFTFRSLAPQTIFLTRRRALGWSRRRVRHRIILRPRLPSFRELVDSARAAWTLATEHELIPPYGNLKKSCAFHASGIIRRQGLAAGSDYAPPD